MPSTPDPSASVSKMLRLQTYHDQWRYTSIGSVWDMSTFLFYNVLFSLRSWLAHSMYSNLSPYNAGNSLKLPHAIQTHPYTTTYNVISFSFLNYIKLRLNVFLAISGLYMMVKRLIWHELILGECVIVQTVLRVKFYHLVPVHNLTCIWL